MASSVAAWLSAAFRSVVRMVSRAPAETAGFTTYSSHSGSSVPGSAQCVGTVGTPSVRR